MMMDINNFLNTDRLVILTKWAIMILITGFIAQFGKKFAEFLLVKFKRNTDKKETKTYIVEENNEKVRMPEKMTSQGNDHGFPEKSQLKALKKQEKSRQKTLKKQNRL